MDLETFIVAVSYTIDEELHELAVQERWRTRGPKPRLADREVLTMEVVGEYLGIDTDQGLSTYFRRHDGAWFPELRRVHRTTFSTKPRISGRSRNGCRLTAFCRSEQVR